jgi:mono/diheme cytochrome c family protein
MRIGWRHVVGILLVSAAAGIYITAPKTPSLKDYSALTGDTGRGVLVFTASGCASCHMAAEAEGEAQLVLSGRQKFPSDFGTFVAPNISPDPTFGIGGWTTAAFAVAVRDGVSPEGEHYFPAMPYTAYSRMTDQDLVDLKVYMDTLPASDEPSQAHEVSFPFNIRRSIGGWKFLFMRDDWVINGELTPEQTRGRYIVEALAHCGECHTPRNLLGGLERDMWLSGAPNPADTGKVPNITPAGLKWRAAEVVEYLTTGFTPEFDSVGGYMGHVVENMSKLPKSDREAVAAYLQLLPPRP